MAIEIFRDVRDQRSHIIRCTIEPQQLGTTVLGV